MSTDKREDLAFLKEKGFKWNPAYDIICSYMADNENKGLVMVGSCGTGKSIILNSALPILFNMSRFVMCPVTAYDLSAHNFRKLLQRKFIAIDEIGREFIGNDYGSKFEMLEIIADHCEKNGKLLFLTSNLSYEALLTRYGEPCIDRLKKICKWVEFTGESCR